MASRRSSLLAMLSLAGQLLLPLALVPADGRHGCTEDVCRCGHRAPSRPAEEPCHGHEAAPAECQMSATCNHELAMAIVMAPLYEMPTATQVETPRPEAAGLPAVDPATVRRGFARLEPHPPPAL